MDLCVEFEVVLGFEELLTDVTFKFPSRTVSDQMTAEIPLAGKHLRNHRDVNTYLMSYY